MKTEAILKAEIHAAILVALGGLINSERVGGKEVKEIIDRATGELTRLQELNDFQFYLKRINFNVHAPYAGNEGFFPCGEVANADKQRKWFTGKRKSTAQVLEEMKAEGFRAALPGEFMKHVSHEIDAGRSKFHRDIVCLGARWDERKQYILIKVGSGCVMLDLALEPDPESQHELYRAWNNEEFLGVEI